MISRTTFHLKGSGWYATDYGGKKAPVTETASEGESSAVSTSDPAPDTSEKTSSATTESSD
jgi:predicted nucleic acid-binding Zn ribbon protein